MSLSSRALVSVMMSRKVDSKTSKKSNASSRNALEDLGHGVGPSGLLRDSSGRIVEYFAEDDVCPICQSDRYLNPNLRLLVSRCYHKLCESCIERVFGLSSEPCPTCGQLLRKTHFNPQTFESLGVEKEVVIRKMISRSFNKREDDFETSKDYNNYLEEVEDIIFNLVNGVDVQETELKIKQIQQQSQLVTQQNQVRDALESDLQNKRDVVEKRQREERRRRLLELEMADEVEEAQLEAETIQELANSEQATQSLMSERRKAAKLQRLERAQLLSLEDSNSQTQQRQPSWTGLLDSTTNASETVFDPLSDANQYQDYSELYLLSGHLSLNEEALCYDSGSSLLESITSIGGFDVQDVRTRNVRSAVMGLFVPVLDGQDSIPLPD